MHRDTKQIRSQQGLGKAGGKVAFNGHGFSVQDDEVPEVERGDGRTTLDVLSAMGPPHIYDC